jgi:GNAT superfamily N-acetyltransferase
MKITEVKSEKDWKAFHQVQHFLYRNDPKWIAPLQGDIRSVFDPTVNMTFKKGEAACFLLANEEGTFIGRIAAFIDHARNEIQKNPIGGIGFFECINDKKSAFVLFEHATEWLVQRGAEVIDGPINFGERDKFWGLLVKGFEAPLYQENYNPTYYRDFFEDWGFIPFEQIITYIGDSENIPVDRMKRVMQRVRKNHQVETRSLDYGKLPVFAADFCGIYNAAFSKYGHFKPLEPAQVIKMLNEAKPIADPYIMNITYFDDEPAGFCALLPDINELIRFAKGRLNWWKIPVLLWNKYRTKQYTAKGIGFGIHPEYQKKGAYPAIIEHIANARNIYRYPIMALTTVRAHNTDAVSVYKKLGVSAERIHIAYRKALKEDIPIEPFEFTEEY